MGGFQYKQTYAVLVDEAGRILEYDNSFKAPIVQQIEHHMIHDGDHYYVEDFVTLGDNVVLDFCIVIAAGNKPPHIVVNFDATAQMELEIFRGVTFAADGALVVPHNNNHFVSWVGTHTPAGTSATVLTDSTQSWDVDALIGLKVYNVSDGSCGVIVSNTSDTVTVAALIGGAGNDFVQNDQYEINASTLSIETGCTVTATGVSQGRISSGSALTPSKGVPGGSTRADELVTAVDTKYLFRFTSRLAANILSYKFTWYEHAPE